MIALYFASILDHNNKEVIKLEYTTSAKHSAFLAKDFIEHCPPAIGFKINKIVFDLKQVAYMANRIKRA